VSWATPFAEKALRHQRRACILGAALIAACYPIDLAQQNTVPVMIIRTLWIATALFGAWAQQPARPGLAMLGGHLTGTITGAAVASIIALSGGSHSVYDGMFLATPFAVLVALPELPMAAGVAGLQGVLGGLWIRHAEGQPTYALVGWVIVSSAMGILAVYGTVMTRRLFREQVEAALERARALEALMESERRRDEAEELAEAGRVAASVVHDMNSPLAALRTNLRSLAVGDVEPSERDEVLADAVAGVERITGVVSALGRSIHPTRARPPTEDGTRRVDAPVLPIRRGPGRS
jgi:signal transduction histidine kinase